jgi:calcineurin-like phosphoesterase family protein
MASEYQQLIAQAVEEIDRPSPKSCSPTPCPGSGLKLVLMSDTHDSYPKDVPSGDVLIHSGDFACGDDVNSLRRDIDWLSSLPHRHKLLVLGNHDLILRRNQHLLGSITLLADTGITIDGVSFYGLDWGSSVVPANVDVLISHAPPFGILDGPSRIGSKELRMAVLKAQPKVHVFGHEHAHGHVQLGSTHFYNAAMGPGEQPWIHNFPIGE